MMLERVLTRAMRVPGFRALWLRFPLGPLTTRLKYDVISRPHYAYGLYSAARLAKRLGIPVITAAEFGVAGGRGLLAMERISAEIANLFDIQIEVVGFDSGTGMPAPLDYRDAPHAWQAGYYRMDVNALQSVLKPTTRLILGEVNTSVHEWARTSTAPLGFAAFDLDYYSSTMHAFQIFKSPSHLPRVFCYFDDIHSEVICHNDYIGELCAIREFNQAHERIKICPIHGLRHMRAIPAVWNDQIYVMHDFDHPLYCKNISAEANFALTL